MVATYEWRLKMLEYNFVTISYDKVLQFQWNLRTLLVVSSSVVKPQAKF